MSLYDRENEWTGQIISPTTLRIFALVLIIKVTEYNYFFFLDQYNICYMMKHFSTIIYYMWFYFLFLYLCELNIIFIWSFIYIYFSALTLWFISFCDTSAPNFLFLLAENFSLPVHINDYFINENYLSLLEPNENMIIS